MLRRNVSLPRRLPYTFSRDMHSLCLPPYVFLRMCIPCLTPFSNVPMHSDRYNNCSLRVPWVAKEKPSSNGARGEPGKLEGTSLPLFLILGEQKAGTTFLRMLLDQHPRLRAGLGLYGRPAGETHYFDKAMRGQFIPQEPAAMAKAYAEYFAIQAEDMDDEDTMPFGFDTSPSYLAWQEAVPLYVSSWLARTAPLLRSHNDEYFNKGSVTFVRHISSLNSIPYQHCIGGCPRYFHGRS